MFDSFVSFFQRSKQIPLTGQERSSIKASLEAYIRRHPRVDSDSLPPLLRKQHRGAPSARQEGLMQPDEKLALLSALHAFMDESPQALAHAQGPLYFGTWSGNNLFRILEPFSCAPRQKR